MKKMILTVFAIPLMTHGALAQNCIELANETIASIESEPMPILQWVNPIADQIDGMSPMTSGTSSLQLAAALGGVC